MVVSSEGELCASISIKCSPCDNTGATPFQPCCWKGGDWTGQGQRTRHKHVLSQPSWLLWQESSDGKGGSHGAGAVLFWAVFHFYLQWKLTAPVTACQPPNLNSLRVLRRIDYACVNRMVWKILLTWETCTNLTVIGSPPLFSSCSPCLSLLT